jgi:hypothetical protein
MSYLRRRPKHLVITERHIYHAELESCPACGQPLELCGHYSWCKTVQQLDKVVYVASRPKECRNAACQLYKQPLTSVVAQSVALPHSTYGLDVVAQIGWWREREHLSHDEIYKRLQPQVQLGRRQVDLLYQRYQQLLAAAAQPQIAELAATVQRYGGVLVSVDGLEPQGAQEQLWVVREGLSGQILATAWLPRVNVETLTALLQPVQRWLAQQGWPVLATLSDKQGVLSQALAAVWPAIPHQWCQAHYLRNVADPLYAQDHQLKTDLRRDVRQAMRRSLSAVAAAAAAGGDFSPSGAAARPTDTGDARKSGG